MQCPKCPKCGEKMIKIKEVVSKGITKIKRITCKCPKCGYQVQITKYN